MASDQKQSDDEMRQEARTRTDMKEPAPYEAEANLPSEAQGLIGHQLRQEYRRILAEPLPDKFGQLLEQLAKSETAGKTEIKK